MRERFGLTGPALARALTAAGHARCAGDDGYPDPTLSPKIWGTLRDPKTWNREGYARINRLIYMEPGGRVIDMLYDVDRLGLSPRAVWQRKLPRWVDR